MTQSTEQKNQTLIAGKVTEECVLSHEMFGEKFYEFKIAVQRLSDSADILPVTISERLIDISLLKVGTEVEIDSQIRSYNNQKNEGNKLKITLFARGIEVVESLEKNTNEVFLDGFICKPPVYRKTPLGREICDIIIAVNRTYHKSDYIPVITWGRNAKWSEKLQVGDSVKIWGRIQSREYDKKISETESIRKVAYEISASKLEMNPESNNKVKPE